MNYLKAINEGIKLLQIKNIKNPKLDTELILSNTLKKNREEILTNLRNSITKNEIDEFKNNINRRLKNEPVAYILGFKYFWKYKFLVNKSVLIPRPETECIVQESLNFIPANKSKKILDIGTGSGCIIISILKERSKCQGFAIDISKKALKVARTNAKLHHIKNKIKFINIDVDKFKSSKYDLIISNPPYINNISMIRLDDDVKLFEPKLALSGGLSGYNVIKKVILKGKKLLKNNGRLIIEIGFDQKNLSLKLLKKNGFYINKICKDLSGKDRCIVSTKINK
tara:strand:+ start:821 stop:1669 length:849 start_codon:yes stop_codon:yes gene_type:complete